MGKINLTPTFLLCDFVAQRKKELSFGLQNSKKAARDFTRLNVEMVLRQRQFNVGPT